MLFTTIKKGLCSIVSLSLIISPVIAMDQQSKLAISVEIPQLHDIALGTPPLTPTHNQGDSKEAVGQPKKSKRKRSPQAIQRRRQKERSRLTAAKEFIKENPNYIATVTSAVAGQVVAAGQLAWWINETDLLPNELYIAESLFSTGLNAVNLGSEAVAALRKICEARQRAAHEANKNKEVNLSATPTKEATADAAANSDTAGVEFILNPLHNPMIALSAAAHPAPEPTKIQASTHLPTMESVLADDRRLTIDISLPVNDPVQQPAKPAAGKKKKFKKPSMDDAGTELTDFRKAIKKSGDTTLRPSLLDRIKDFIQETPGYAVAATSATLGQLASFYKIKEWIAGTDGEYEKLYNIEAGMSTALNVFYGLTMTTQLAKLKYQAYRQAQQDAIQAERARTASSAAVEMNTL